MTDIPSPNPDPPQQPPPPGHDPTLPPPMSEVMQREMDALRYGDLFGTGEELDELESERRTLESAAPPRLYVLLPLMAGAVFVWAAVLVGLFISQHYGLLLTYAGLLEFGDYHFGGFRRFPVLELAFGGIALGLMWALGRFFMGGYESYIPRPAHHCLAFTLGLGISGVGLTLLTLGHLLYQVPVIALWLVLFVWAWRRMVRMQRTWENPVEAGAELFNIEAEKGTRAALARRQFALSIHEPRGLLANGAMAAIMTLLIVITLLTFWHALFYPETYWDSLILYLGWARKIFTQHHFPLKVTAQVGVGLGANYPHLYEVHVAGVATMFNRWSDLYGRLLAPAATLASLVLVYQTALYLTRSQLIAAAAALAYRVIPAGMAYSVYASNYSLTMLFFAAFLYAGILYIDTGRRPYLVFLTLITAFGMHINYLMGILWVAWAAAVWLAHWRAEVFDVDDPEGKRTVVFFEGRRATSCVMHSFQHMRRRPRLGEMARQRWLWALLGAGIVIGGVWYARNWIVTGNPVYAFFPGIFGGKNINMEVLQSAEEEWLANGDGIERYVGTKALWPKLRHSWDFFVGRREINWKWGPIWMALAVPGMALALLLPLARGAIRPRNQTEQFFLRQILSPTLLRGGALAVVMAALLLWYHYCISGIYLYQIICMLPLCGVFAAIVLHVAALARLGGLFKGLIIALIIVCGVVPGLPFALQGFKWKGEAIVGGRVLQPFTLYHLRRPMMDSDLFYRLEFNGEVDMWEYVNTTLPGRKILTHENRNLLYDETITFVHLDDWEMQPLYGMSDPAARAANIRAQGIEHYLYLPMEDKSPVNKRAGMEELIRLGYARKDKEAGGMILYYITAAPGGQIDDGAPPNTDSFAAITEGWGELPGDEKNNR